MDVHVRDEPALRAHIRKLLLHYSLTHLTIDYVTHTNIKVSELLFECLNFVPTDDPTSLALPVEPFQRLSQLLRLNEQEPYDQVWQLDLDSRALIAGILSGGNNAAGEPPTKRCWSAEDAFSYSNPYSPFETILTRRALRETPSIGAPSNLHKLSNRVKPQIVEHLDIKPVPDDIFEETIISTRERDRLLGFHLSLDKATHQAITSLLTQNPGAQPQSKLSMRGATPIPRMASEFLRVDNSPPPTALHHPMSLPIFSRQASGTALPGLEKLSDIHSLGLITKVKEEAEEAEDLSEVHMHLIDGWSVMAPPYPSQRSSVDTPSLDAGSQSSQVDELFALTPPRQVPIGMHAHEKMEEYLIPRNRKPGGGRKDFVAGEPQQSLSDFLPSLLSPKVANFEPNTLNTFQQNAPSVSLSVLGQPSSPLGSCTTIHDIAQERDLRLVREEENYALDTGLDTLISKLCAPVEGQNAEDWIIQEKVAEKEALMMNTPILREPHLHPASSSCPIMPTSMRSLVSTKQTKHQLNPNKDPEQATACLKKVAGVQSLNIELSWRPFNFGASVPKTEEIVDVEQGPVLDFQYESTQTDRSNDGLQNLFNTLEHPGTGAEKAFGVNELPSDWAVLGEESSRYDVILTKAERRRLSGYQQDGVDSTGVDSESDIEVLVVSGIESPIASSNRDTFAAPLPAVNTVKPVEEAAAKRFSFHTLCSPKPNVDGNISPQHHSQDAPFWNIQPSDVQVRVNGDAQDFIEHHLDPADAGREEVLGGHLKPDGVNYLPVGDSQSQISYSNEMEFPVLVPVSDSRSDLELCPPTPLDPSHPPLHSHEWKPARPTRIKPQDPVSTTHRSEKSFAREALVRFMEVRGKAAHGVESSAVPFSQPELEPKERVLPGVMAPSPPRGTPMELIDSNTLSLPHDWAFPDLTHRYISSLDLIQKTILLEHLSSPACNVELVQRDTGADLILDADTAVLFVALAPLPVTGKELAERIACLSWDFARIVIVFEAFSTSLLYRRDKNAGQSGAGQLAPYAFSPAIVKAVRNFKRTLAIMEGMQTGSQKRRETKVEYAYAQNVSEAARFARWVGDMRGSVCAVGDDREWLTDDPQEDETDLAQVKGMNVFAAALILRHIGLNSFVEMEAGPRLEMFSELVGEQRVATLNEEITKHLVIVTAATVSSPPFSPTTVSPNFEIMGDHAYYDLPDVDQGHVQDKKEDQPDIVEWQTTGLLQVPGKEMDPTRTTELS